MWQEIIVGLIVIVAAFFVVRRLSRHFRGIHSGETNCSSCDCKRCGCDEGSASDCETGRENTRRAS